MECTEDRIKKLEVLTDFLFNMIKCQQMLIDTLIGIARNENAQIVIISQDLGYTCEGFDEEIKKNKNKYNDNFNTFYQNVLEEAAKGFDDRFNKMVDKVFQK